MSPLPPTSVLSESQVPQMMTIQAVPTETKPASTVMPNSVQPMQAPEQVAIPRSVLQSPPKRHTVYDVEPKSVLQDRKVILRASPLFDAESTQSGHYAGSRTKARFIQPKFQRYIESD